MNAKPSTDVTAADLRQWRKAKGHSLREVAEMLGVNSPNTVKTWEDDDVKMPGPARLLLAWLIHGQQPFDAETVEPALREATGKVEMSLDAFLECQRRALEGGFGSVTEWIAALVREALATEPTAADVQKPLEQAAAAFLAQTEGDALPGTAAARRRPQKPSGAHPDIQGGKR